MEPTTGLPTMIESRVGALTLTDILVCLDSGRLKELNRSDAKNGAGRGLNPNEKDTLGVEKKQKRIHH